ncbi:MAG: peptidoglycan DD-metalloendopeptidase family protein [bacterium]|nr:peptidoglycan DD-metalloendopeptidase family protein [bacterium]
MKDLRLHRPILLLQSILVLLTVFAAESIAGLQEIQKELGATEESLREVQESIQEKKKILRNFEKKEKGVLAQIQTMEKKLALKEEQLQSYDAALKRVQEEKGQLEAEIADLEGEMGRLQDYLAYKVVQIYKHGKYSYVKALFSAGSYVDLLKRFRQIRVFAMEDSSNINRYRQVYAALAEKETILAGQEEKILTLQNDFKEKNKEVLAKRNERTRLLSAIRKEQGLQKELLEELEASAMSLQMTIDNLVQQKESLYGNFKQRKGALAWPVKGPVVTEFGKHKHEKFNTYIFSKGINIAAKRGEDVRNVYNGTVLFADWFKGYGKMVILDHGKGFFSVYAHLAEISVPVKSAVESGQVIGKVGDTGSLQGPVLYFEIRHHGEPQDPLSWLAAR